MSTYPRPCFDHLERLSDGSSDGLEPDGRSENQGAEATIAMLSTLPDARLLVGQIDGG